ncbi:MAG: glycosyltransferase [Ahrensia sp.]
MAAPMPMLTVLFISNDYRSFMAHRASLTRHLAARGHRVVLAVGYVPDDISDANEIGLEVRPLPINRWRFSPLADLATWQALSGLVATLQPDVVHTITAKPTMFACLLLKRGKLPGTNVVLTFAGLGRLFEAKASLPMRVQRFIVGLVLRAVADRPQLDATFENAADKATIQAFTGMADGRLHVTRGAGVDLSRFVPPEKPRSGQLTVLFASRLLKAKGIDLYMHCARQFSAQYGASFVIAGPTDSGDADAVSEAELMRAHADGFIDYIGLQPMTAMPELLRRTDIMCLPTRYGEGFPRIVIEAMAAGCAVISSDHASLTSLVDNQRNGWLYPVTDDSAFVQALEVALSHPDETRAKGTQAALDIRAAGVDEDAVNAHFERIYAAQIERNAPAKSGH